MADNNRIVIFHVGLPKTASTFLQRNVFPHLKQVHYVKKHDFKRHEKIVEKSSHYRILLSTEFNPHPGNKRAQQKLDRIKRNFEHIYPVIVLRKHSSWLKSKYKYYIRKHGSYPFTDFIDPKNDQGAAIRKDLYFFQKIKHLEETYDRRPLVLFQEELKSNPIDTVKVIADFMGATFDEEDIEVSTIKKSYSEHQLKWVRKFNRNYSFRPEKVKPRPVKKLYKKISQLFLHSTAYAGKFLPDPEPENPLIPKDLLKQIDNEYKEDWEQCKAYAKETRELLF